MSSETEICNLALSHVGVGKEIANLDTEKSTEASACRRFYDTTRDSILRDFQWPFATTITSLGLVETSPNGEWNYSYRYPSDCVYFRRILSGVRHDTIDSLAPFKIIQDAAGSLILSDTQNAECEYTVRAIDPGHYPSDFTLCFSYKLAFFIAARVTRGDPFKLGAAAQENYKMNLADAVANAYNEEQDDKKADSELVTTRL